MSGWLSQVVLGSTGLALTALATAVVLQAWRHRPLASYRLATLVLGAALLLPGAQLTARHVGVPLVLPVRAWVDGLRAREPGPVAPVAAVTSSVPARASADSEATGLDPALLALLLLGQDGTPAVEPRASVAAGGIDAAPGFVVRALPWLAALYGLGVLVSLAHTLRRLASTRALLRSAERVRDPGTLRVWREVLAGSPLAGGVRLVESGRVRAPACSGLGAPVVVLPLGDRLARRPEVLACVLTHELVHLERRDAWVQLGEEFLRALFWFHPAAWWLSARLERLREVSCDLLVVKRTGKRRRYASALLEYAAWMQSGSLGPDLRAGSPAAVLPWSTSKGQLARRIEMLLRKETTSKPVVRWVAPAAVGILFFTLWSCQVALAANGTPEDESVPEEGAHAAVVHDGDHQKKVVKRIRIGDGKDVQVIHSGDDQEDAGATDGDREITIHVVTRDGKTIVSRGGKKEHVIDWTDARENTVIDLTDDSADLKGHIVELHEAHDGDFQVVLEAGESPESIQDVYFYDSKSGDLKKVSSERKRNVWFGEKDSDGNVHKKTTYEVIVGGKGKGKSRSHTVIGIGGGKGKGKSKRHAVIGIGGGKGKSKTYTVIGGGDGNVQVLEGDKLKWKSKDGTTLEGDARFDVLLDEDDEGAEGQHEWYFHDSTQGHENEHGDGHESSHGIFFSDDDADADGYTVFFGEDAGEGAQSGHAGWVQTDEKGNVFLGEKGQTVWFSDGEGKAKGKVFFGKKGDNVWFSNEEGEAEGNVFFSEESDSGASQGVWVEKGEGNAWIELDGHGRFEVRGRTEAQECEGDVQVFELHEGEASEAQADYLLQRGDHEAHSKKLREDANRYYEEVDPDDFRRTVNRYLTEEAARTSDEDAKKAYYDARLRDQADAADALENARRVLARTSDEDLARKTAYAKAWTQSMRDLEDRAAVESAEVDELKRELDATREMLDRQRAELDKMRAILEDMREREKQRRDTLR